jgi:hypothetical protein
MILVLHRKECEPGDYTELAELAAHDLAHDEWLNDETHRVWDLAIEVSDNWAPNFRKGTT